MADVVIVGGGVIGLLVARELAATGLGVELIEQGYCGGEASWAGGGIVSPLYPWRYNAAVTALSCWAQDYYPGLSRELLAETGIDPELQACGLLMLEAEDESEALAWADTGGRRMTAVDAAFIQDRQPALSPTFRRGLWMPDVANIRNPRLTRALRTALQSAGVVIREQTRLYEVIRNGGRVQAVSLRDAEGGEFRVKADQYVFCTGAWTGRLLQGVDLLMPVEPVKGQMLLYELPHRLLNEMVLYQGRYLIPRKDGHVLVGSTLEQAGFDKQTTAEARESLQRSAQAILPLLADLPVKQHWAGLRPGAPDGIPFIGALPGLDNAWVNAGHYRNGLVLAPASARLLADLMTDREPIVCPSPYDPRSRQMQVLQSRPSFFIR